MSAAPSPRREPQAKVLRLPEIDDTRIPGWRIARNAVRWTIGIFAALAIVTVTVAALRTMRVTVSGTGVLEPTTMWQVRSSENGIVSEVLVRAGDTVAKEQVVARLDTLAVAAQVADIASQLRAARIDLERMSRSMPVDAERGRTDVAAAEAQRLRARTALRQRMAEYAITGDPDSIAVASASGRRIHLGLDGPAADLLAAQAALDAARARLQSLALAELDVDRRRADVERLASSMAAMRVHLDRHLIRAGAAGVVLTDQVERLRGVSVVAGQELLEIAGDSHWRAAVSVPERNVYRVRVGDTVDVEVVAFATMPTNHFLGRVESIGWQAASTGTAAQNSAGYRVIVRMDSSALAPLSHGELRRGYAVNAEIVTRSERALTLLIEYFRDRGRALAR